MKFLDEAKIYVRSGNGGAGCLSFRREKFIEFGGPDGGDGGRGGDVVAVCTPGLNTLIDFRYQQHYRAGTGGYGMGKNRTGARGKDALLPVPLGTQIFDLDGTLLCDLNTAGERFVIAEGGNGGFGNARFKTSTNRAPRHANPGQSGVEMTLVLRLKLIADVGLLGLPNAGKSTLLARVSAARPKIADYPFTTLHPGLGVVTFGDGSFVVADIPGLIEGAHAGLGLGTRFLGHIERCRIVLHLVDATLDNPAKAYRTIRRELAAYGGVLANKPELVALSKCDAVLPEHLADKIKSLRRAMREFPAAHGRLWDEGMLAGSKHKRTLLCLSGVTGEGVDGCLGILAQALQAMKANAPEQPKPQANFSKELAERLALHEDAASADNAQSLVHGMGDDGTSA